MNYQDFIQTKIKKHQFSGFEIDENILNSHLFNFQKFIVKKALKAGKYAVFADCGLGKTIMQLEWAYQVWKYTHQPVLILAPLAVSGQTIQEGKKFGIEVFRYTKMENPMTTGYGGIWISNYEQLDNINCEIFGGVVLDESGILKNFEGKIRNKLMLSFKNTLYKLCCTAIPSPNDPMESGNHSEFIDIMPYNEMLAMYFYHDGGETSKWQLKGHAVSVFYEWMGSWAVMLSNPCDIGFKQDGFNLPPINFIEKTIVTEKRENGKLFNDISTSATEFNQELRLTMNKRMEIVTDLVNNKKDNFIIWIKQNIEGEYLKKIIPDAIEVKGSDTNEYKEKMLLGFARGDFRVLITKPKIAQYGMNYQNCNNHIHASLDFCYSSDTEVLTKNRWKLFTELKHNEVMATVNPQTLKFEWQKNTGVFNIDYEGELHHYIGLQNYDLLVTPNHNLFVKRNNKRYQRNCGQWHLKKSEDLIKNYKRMEFNMLTTTHGFVGKYKKYIKIPPLSFQKKDKRNNKIKRIKIDDFMKLAGWYVSEGYATLNKNGNRVCGTTRITQSQTHILKKEYREEIEQLAKRISPNANIKHKEVIISGTNLAKFMIDNFGSTSYKKKIPKWVKNFDSRYLIILRDTMLKGDGCHSKKRITCYRTVSKKLAEDFQELCLKTGIRANIKYRNIPASFGVNGRVNIYDVVLAWQNSEPSISVKPKIIKYKGKIGCCSVPNHTLIVRRNGKVCISGNSFESFYQTVRRSYRFGQKKEVNIYIITTDTMSNVIQSIQYKQKQFKIMQDNLRKAVNVNMENKMSVGNYNEDKVENEFYKIIKGDCIQAIKNIQNESIGLSVFSPPFANLYTYSNHVEDMGNSTDYTEFQKHFSYLVKELYRVMVCGRNVAVHCMDLPIQKGKEGFIGLRDFSGMILKCFNDVGFIYHSRITIWKNPVTEMQRTKALGLLHKQIKKDSAMCRVGIPDYVLVFRKDGERNNPIKNTELSVDLWQKYASPVWMDIDYGNTLQGYRKGREDKDEKHICPLQIDTIDRLIHLYSNIGDTVFTPFAGIGSEVYQAVKKNRYGIGIELKESYFELMKKNLESLLREKLQEKLF